MLAAPPLPFTELYRHARAIQVVANGADEWLFLRALQDVIIFDIPTERLQVAIILLMGSLVGLAEDEHLQLSTAHRHQAGGVGLLYLSLKHAAWRNGDRLVALFLIHIAHDEGRPVQPGQQAQAVPIGLAMQVAVALLPTGEAIARHRVHLHIGSQQIIAGVHTTADDFIQEKVPRDALANQPSVHIREGSDDRFYFFIVDQFCEGVQVELASYRCLIAHLLPPLALYGAVISSRRETSSSIATISLSSRPAAIKVAAA